MTRLNNIYSLILGIQKASSRRSKKEKIISLINYVEQANKDIKEIRSNLKAPYLNENKITLTLLEIQIQMRLMQIGYGNRFSDKRFQEISVYLFNIYALTEKAKNQSKNDHRQILRQWIETRAGADRRRYSST